MRCFGLDDEAARLVLCFRPREIVGNSPLRLPAAASN
jgi:hypothetical protein